MPLNLKLLKRPRRNRKNEIIRKLIQENFLLTNDLIAPFFLAEGKQIRAPINSLPGQCHLSLDFLNQEIEEHLELGIQSILLFPLISSENKDFSGSYALSEKNHLLIATQKIKEKFPDVCVMADVALDPFTTHGHDGLLSSSGEILNDETIDILSKMSLLYAKAGVDVIAPSDMMDGRIQIIRETLDENDFKNVSIMAYSAKYASSLYSPFRDALKSAPAFGNKKSYQLNPANSREALIEAKLDEEEGADILMIKPATFYLDVIQKIRQQTNLPIAAYHVSGEYAMIKAAAQNKWINFERVLYEALLSIKRAGADMIISYGAKEIAREIKELS